MATLALPPQAAAPSGQVLAPQEPSEQFNEQFGGDGFPELPENLQKALKDLLRKALQREMYARRQEVMESRKQRFYDRGIQYIYWDYGAWGFAPLTAGPTNSPG